MKSGKHKAGGAGRRKPRRGGAKPKDLSRQRRWQLKMKDEGLCIKCAQPAVVHVKGKRKGKVSPYCLEHLVKNREHARNKYGHTKRLQSFSYRLEAAKKPRR